MTDSDRVSQVLCVSISTTFTPSILVLRFCHLCGRVTSCPEQRLRVEIRRLHCCTRTVAAVLSPSRIGRPRAHCVIERLVFGSSRQLNLADVLRKRLPNVVSTSPLISLLFFSFVGGLFQHQAAALFGREA